ncbi:hypothetical protein A2164_02510 [Candidatus Curtissbacteria bacterium RBG_13_35_7]|uniref:Uncharacterized protein n=1 Tax=Candidatus Curtissbacteria bacterium RBG_13_35_7 TaxID=1797705 RepID=A0A1F5G2Z4_9BACT|nr:MAG: hypothetical protein A2164_02510 [Candidatus Curtissbacteria bacterium RBG_13_35_7]
MVFDGLLVGNVFWLNRLARTLFTDETTASPENISITFSLVTALLLSVLLSRAAFSYNSKYGNSLLEKWGQFFPNTQIPSIVLGRASLLLNSGKLIRLREK